MMLALLYHRIGNGKRSNPPDTMRDHLEYIAGRYRTVLPGDVLDPFSPSVCLTFDDATYDFYHYVYPLLKRLHLRAVLAVPVRFIQNSSQVHSSTRLSVPYLIAMKDNVYRTHVPFCTWEELQEMTSSGHVEIASHSFSHVHLLTPNLDLDHEIAGSQRILQTLLKKKIRTFVYPFGKFNHSVHQKVRQHYEFAMRIGTAWNWSWQNRSQVIYRVICDNLPSIRYPFSFLRKGIYAWSYLINSIRGR
jgi:peptidoglycan/xylan/chitin deacetylase (PgdA/CDA1 family)